jgi:ABC-2 type transport system permease protein
VSSTWSDVRLIAGREVWEKLHSKAFVLSTLLFLAVVAASLALPALLYDDDPARYDVAVVGSATQALVEAVPEDELDLRATAADRERARELVRDEEVDAAVELGGEGLLLTARQEVPGDLRAALTTTHQLAELEQALTGSGTPPGEVARLLSPVPVQEQRLDAGSVGSDVLQLLTVAFAMLFFFVVYQFGFSIAQGVATEKESRVVELLVSTVPVRTLLWGKVLGNGGLALAQVVLLVAVAVAGAALTGESELVSLLARNAGWFVLFFALGFAMLSCLWAAAGAFASRSEDLQSTTAPLQVLVILPFFASVYVGDGALRTVLSFVPFSSPIFMPGRLVQGDAAGWEAAVAAVLLLAAAFAAVLVGERLYRSSLLRTRGRTGLREAWSGRTGASG